MGRRWRRAARSGFGGSGRLAGRDRDQEALPALAGRDHATRPLGIGGQDGPAAGGRDHDLDQRPVLGQAERLRGLGELLLEPLDKRGALAAQGLAEAQVGLERGR